MTGYHFLWIFQKIRSPSWTILTASLGGNKGDLERALGWSLIPVICSPHKIIHHMNERPHGEGTLECKLWIKGLYLAAFLEVLLFWLEVRVVKCTSQGHFGDIACTHWRLGDTQLDIQRCGGAWDTPCISEPSLPLSWVQDNLIHLRFTENLEA